ncbi:outer membrane protein [Mariniphaga anaerophila]|uniref:Outer membrane protein n=1 Tax=Mariniphaga anaerophila TaxID=1484053 RepID=A0A1M5FPU1_9BACT|nr:TolC family protein [Mariniphaga anaerophila]SHF93525.1 outer membrane protein [Mariniphaga anaerophila]
MRLYLILITGLLFLSEVSEAQDKWTLEQCIRYAVSNNLDLKITSIENEIKKEDLSQSKRNILPSVSLSSGGNNSFGRSLDYTSYQYVNTSQFYSSLNISGGMDIFRGFIRQNTISLRKMALLAGIEDEKQLQYDIAFVVMGAYYNTLYYNGLAEIAAEQKELSELNLKQTKKQAELGLKAKSDLLEMESRLAAEELSLIQAQNHFKTELLRLRQAMNIENTGEFEIDLQTPEVEITAGQATTPSEIFETATHFYPALKATEMRRNVAEKNISLAKGQLWPRLSLSGAYATNYASLKGQENTASFQKQFKNNAYQYVGVSLTIPVFEQLGLRSGVKKARLNYLQAETELEKKSQLLYNEIDQNYQQLESSLAEYNQLVKQVRFAQTAYEAAEKKLAQGLISIIELYDSKNVLGQAKTDLLKTKLQYAIRKKTLDFYLGKPVFEVETSNAQ